MAAKELGSVTAKTDGPTKPTSTSRSLHRQLNTQGVDGILFAATIRVAISPLLKKRLSKASGGRLRRELHPGGAPVVREPGPVQRDRQVAHGQHGRRSRDRKLRIFTSTFTTPNQARWIARWRLRRQVPPKMKWLETVEAQEDNVLSFNQATTLINSTVHLKGTLRNDQRRYARRRGSSHAAKKCGQLAVIGWRHLTP